MGGVAAVAVVGLSLEVRREPENFDRGEIVCRNDDIALLTAVDGIDVSAAGDLGPNTLDVPAVDGRVGRPAFIAVSLTSVRLNFLTALTGNFVVKHLTAEVVHLEYAAVH